MHCRKEKGLLTSSSPSVLTTCPLNKEFQQIYHFCVYCVYSNKEKQSMTHQPISGSNGPRVGRRPVTRPGSFTDNFLKELLGNAGTRLYLLWKILIFFFLPEVLSSCTCTQLEQCLLSHLYFFFPTGIKNKSCKPGSDFSASISNQFVPVKGDRLPSSLTFFNFREEMPVCPIFSSYMGISLKEPC